MLLALVPGAGADNGTVTFSSTSTFPVPPASSFTANGGGDGWAVALTPSAVYNVFHHSGETMLACHYQSDGSPCWGSDYPAIRIYQQSGESQVDFSAAGQPSLYLDQASGKLYMYTVRSSDRAAGVLCMDTKAIDPALNPQFDPKNTNGFNPDGRLAICSSGGFTPLSAPNEAQDDGYNHLGAAAQIGSRWYAFNWFSGQPVSGTMNKVLCFDLKTFGACPNQPYPLANVGTGTVSVGTPGPSVAAMGSKLIVPLNIGGADLLACFDTTAADLTNTDQTSCGAGWPTNISQVASGFGSGEGAPFPMLSASGGAVGICLPNGNDPCWDLSGKQVDTPPGMTSAIHGAVVWNGPPVVIGPRVYVPEWNNEVDCYDFSTQANCQLKDANGQTQFTFPKYVSGSSGLYTVNSDPQRPNCLWVNSDNGQIANFDAFTGGACGQGPIRVVTSTIVGTAPQCFPSNFSSLKIDDPAPSAYTSGTVVFADASGNPLAGAAPIPLNNGVADLSSLHLSVDQALPQFLITLTNGDAALRPQAVTVTVTWTGTFDPACASGNTTIENPPTPAPTPTPPPAAPPTPNIGVTATAPPVARLGNNVTFTATVKNTSSTDDETGSQLTAAIPAGSTVVSASSTQGTCMIGTQIFCGIGTIAKGASATITVVVKANQVGTLTFSPKIAGDFDTSFADNSATVSTPVEQPGATPPAPPAPTTPGTLNAISVGTVVVNGVTIPSDTYFVLKAGDVVQLNGTLVFTTIGGSVGIFSNVPFTGSRSLSGLLAHLHAAETGPTTTFTVAAPQSASDGTNLTLGGGDFSSCTSPRRLSAKPNSTVVRQLWGQAHGQFTTTGKYSAATIRGTTWGVQDRCDGTLTTAVDDVVTVVDNVLKKTVTLNPGQTYLAQPTPFTPPTVKPPTQANTVHSVLTTGLRWQGHLFRTQKSFAAWLATHHSSWAAWKKTHKVLAAALAKR